MSSEFRDLVDVQTETARYLERIVSNLQNMYEEQKVMKDIIIQDQREFILNVQKIIDSQKVSGDAVIEKLNASCDKCRSSYLYPIKRDLFYIKIWLGSLCGLIALAKFLSSQ